MPHRAATISRTGLQQPVLQQRLQQRLRSCFITVWLFGSLRRTTTNCSTYVTCDEPRQTGIVTTSFSSRSSAEASTTMATVPAPLVLIACAVHMNRAFRLDVLEPLEAGSGLPGAGRLRA